jgi:hypothetical protein
MKKMGGWSPMVLGAQERDEEKKRRQSLWATDLRASYDDFVRLFHPDGTVEEKVNAYIKRYPIAKPYKDKLLVHGRKRERGKQRAANHK